MRSLVEAPISQESVVEYTQPQATAQVQHVQASRTRDRLVGGVRLELAE